MATPTVLPEQARELFEADPGVVQVQKVLESLVTVRRYLADAERLANQLESILAGRSVVGAFAELRSVRDRAVLTANRAARVRVDLAKERDRLVAAPAGEAAQVRQERQSLEAQLGRLATDGEGMSAENAVQQGDVDRISHTLTEASHTVELVDSMAGALEQYLLEPSNWGDLGEAEVDAIVNEIRLQRSAADRMRSLADGMREQMDVIRAQVQVGEVSAEASATLRDRHRALVQRETQLLNAGGQGGAASRVNTALDSLDRVEAQLGDVLRVLGQQAEGRGRSLLETVREERAQIDRYRQRLGTIETAAETVVGDYAFYNFETIARRFGEMMFRSDVGVADSAWSLAEEHRRRMIQMGQQRDRDLESIQMEYDDLLGN